MVSSKVSMFVLFTRCQASIITISAEVLFELWGFKEKRTRGQKNGESLLQKLQGKKSSIQGWTRTVNTKNHHRKPQKKISKKVGVSLSQLQNKKEAFSNYERRINAFVSDRWVMMNPFTFVGQMSLRVRGSWM